MNDTVQILQMLSGPLIGSVIGYGTNYIAIKMMFRPYYEKKIGNWTVPFTPGIIPRRQKSIAKALGGAVGNELLTGDDISNAFLSEGVQEAVSEALLSYLEEKKDVTIKELLMPAVSEERYMQMHGQVVDSLCMKLIDGVKDLDLVKFIVEEGGPALREALDGSMLAMFLSDKILTSVAEPIVERLYVWMDTNGAEHICPLLEREVGKVEAFTVSDLEQKLFSDREALKEKIKAAYCTIAREQFPVLLSKISISGIVEEKINAMSVEEVEKLVFSIMKKELNTVINLGAVIGFLLGLSQLLF